MIATSINRWAILLALLAVCVVAPAFSAPVNLTINGYVQGRYTENFGILAPVPPSVTPVDPTDQFSIRRAYLNFRAEIDKNVSAVIMASCVPTVSVMEAYGEYTTLPYRARLGLVRIPYGYEIPLSSSRLLTLERSQVSTALLVPYTFERGLFGYYLNARGINVSAAIVNGTPTDVVNDPNSKKSYVARLAYPVQGGEIGMSAYLGDSPAASGLSQTMNRFGVDLETTLGQLTLISEAMIGRDGSRDSNGGYVTLGYRIPKTKFQPYARFDMYDPDVDVANNEFNRVTTGLIYQVNPNTKATIEYEFIDDDANPDFTGRLGAQYQVTF